MCNVSASFQLTFIAPIWKEAQREPREVLLHYNLKNAAAGLARHIISFERPLRLKCGGKDAFRENYSVSFSSLSHWRFLQSEPKEKKSLLLS